MEKRLPTQKRIIEVLKELKKREGAVWVEERTVLLMIYRRNQIDYKHAGFDGKDFHYSRSEGAVVSRAMKALEGKGKIKRRKVKLKERYRDIPQHRRFGGCQQWGECRLKEE